MQISFTEKKNIRKNFGKLKESLSIPNLIEVQKNSYKELTEFNKIELELTKGFESSSMPEADLYVIGNALSRGNHCVEEILNKNLPYKSGPEMLGEIIKNRFFLSKQL